MADYFPTCPAGQFTTAAGAPSCSVDWTWVEYVPTPWWYLEIGDTAAVLAAIGVLFALAWGLRLIVQGLILNQR